MGVTHRNVGWDVRLGGAHISYLLWCDGDCWTSIGNRTACTVRHDNARLVLVSSTSLIWLSFFLLFIPVSLPTRLSPTLDHIFPCISLVTTFCLVICSYIPLPRTISLSLAPVSLSLQLSPFLSLSFVPVSLSLQNSPFLSLLFVPISLSLQLSPFLSLSIVSVSLPLSTFLSLFLSLMYFCFSVATPLFLASCCQSSGTAKTLLTACQLSPSCATQPNLQKLEVSFTLSRATCPVPDDHTWSNIENFSFTNDFNNEVDRPTFSFIYPRREKDNYNAMGLTCVALFEAKSFCVHSCNVQPAVHLWIMACWGTEPEYKELCDKCQTRMRLPLARRFLLWYRSFWKWLTPSCNISIPHAPWTASRHILILFTINIALSCLTGTNLIRPVFGLLISSQK